MDNKFSTAAIILAAGVGSRMNSDVTKQRMSICGKSVLLRAALAFERARSVDEIVVVCRKDEMDFVSSELSDITKLKKTVVGGECRKDSAKNGFYAVSESVSFVAIHDAARCLISPELIDRTVYAAREHGAASLVGRVFDTVKMVDGGFIKSTVDRNSLRLAQTPQAFEKTLYEKALINSERTDVTDDNMMLELIGSSVYAVEADGYNFKITTRSDIEYAEFLIGKGVIPK